ncbi:MAG: ThuA domain-containing protein [Saprospirales bacterium]|nr:ThuA domain-containing protein [Saprospirales bacterium]
MQRPLTIFIFLFACISAACFLPGCASDDGSPRILIFNKTEFYFHESTDAGTEALQQLCRYNNIRTDVTDDAEVFTEEKLRQYNAVIFLNTAGDVLNYKQEAAFERYIGAGGGFVGIHTAIDTEHNWKWYGKLIGGRFESAADVQQATLNVFDSSHNATKHLNTTWAHADEWFNLKDVDPSARVLLTLDERSCQGGTMGAFHPVSWYREYEGARVFFTALGHTKAAYSGQDFLKHLLGGLQYVIGDNKLPDYNKAQEAAAPVSAAGGTGFVKTNVVCDLYEPMEFDMFPDGKILFIERRGTLKRYDPTSGQTTVVGELKVFIQNEEGLLGLAIDPDWEKNHWIYLYYAPEEGESAIRLSRFVFENNALQLASEQVLLKVNTDRSVHNFHAGGSLEFDAAGYLYLATGDNTDHYDDGYTSIDERPGKSQFDSQKSASNSMDLRGKILRIRPRPDGSYLCPAGNLFVERNLVVQPGVQALLEDPLLRDLVQNGLESRAAGPSHADSARVFRAPATPFTNRGATGRPEIFVMGCRNPFRISFDDRRQTLFWGEPGPDAGVADSTRGPEGYDEINAARTAGFYGWPYVVGPNKPYRDYNYETESAGPYFNPNSLENNSPNNRGARFLPPARRPLIWYPFRSTAEFPLVANGTRCAMAGPTYYGDQYPIETRFPDRFDGKLIIYEWMRGWMLAVGLDSLGRYVGMEPLADNIRVSRPIDMLIDKNGSLWVLDYGTEWYSANPDACLIRIDYIRGADGQSETLAQGNQAPAVQWDFGGKNRSFYTPGDIVNYQVRVSDPEDGSLADGRIQSGDVLVHLDYLEAGVDPGRIVQKIKPRPVPFERGKKLIEGSDCKSCHAMDRKINGPAYQDIAGRYRSNAGAPAALAKKIIQGGSGVWGQTFMIAHPQHSTGDATEMARWILSLADVQQAALQGSYALKPPAKAAGNPPGTFVFYAAYSDRGNAGQPAQTGSQIIALRPAQQQAEQADALAKGARPYKRPLNATSATLVELKDQQYLAYRNIDLRGIRSVRIALEVSAKNQHAGGGQVELRLGSPDGRLAGSVAIPPPNNAGGLSEAVIQVDKSAWPADGALQEVFFVVNNNKAGEKPVAGLDWLRFGF